MKTTEQPAAAGDTEAARPITFNTNVIIPGRRLRRVPPIPQRRADALRD